MKNFCFKSVNPGGSYNRQKPVVQPPVLQQRATLQPNIQTIKSTVSPSNVIIVMDELVAYQNLPSWLLEKLPGYQAISKVGIEFTNIHCNRQMCSPSRASFQTSLINTGIQSNIDQTFQNFYIPNLPYSFETIPKSLKKTYPDIITGYYGKEHLSSQLNFNSNITPAFNTNTTGAFKCYGFDRGGMFGDSFYKDGHGILSDNVYFNTIMNNTVTNVDFIGLDPLTNEVAGYVGVIPFLKARLSDKKQFHLQYHITNPHDTQQFWQNFSQLPTAEQLQFFAPFLKEQTVDVGIKNPYDFNDFFQKAYVQNTNLTTNYFEPEFIEYANYVSSLPFVDSYVGDYAISSITNPINEYYSGMYSNIKSSFTIADDSSDIKSWKNLVNNYYGLIIEADKYVFRLFNFLKNNNMLSYVSIVITSDHGDLMSAHGLKQKGLPFRECVNVPFIVYSPNLNPSIKGTKSSVLGSLLDLAPTIDTLMNINTKNPNYIGTSLIDKPNTYFVPRTTSLPVMHIVNDFVLSQSCLSDPNYTGSILDYKYNFNMIIDYDEVDGKLYKYGRFFNFTGLFSYNFENNVLLTSVPLNIETLFKPEFLIMEYIPEIAIAPTLIILKEFIKTTYEYSNFTFIDAYDKIKEQFKNGSNQNSLELVLYIVIITNFISFLTECELIIPNVYNDFNDIITTSFPTYMDIFCYNITDDPQEVKNLFYKKNSDGTFSYNDEYEPLFSRYNEKLNELTISQCMTSSNNTMTFIVPPVVYQAFFICLFKFGSDISTYTKEQLTITEQTFYLNNMDSNYSVINMLLGILKVF
jgi:arylsulfatase A-like enzyme